MSDTTYITVGKIVTAATQEEAVQVFKTRSQHGIGGVIFKPDIVIPEWTDDQKSRLTDFLCAANPRTKQLAGYEIEGDDWKQLGEEFATKMFSLSLEFNQSLNTRWLRFLKNNDVAEGPHRDGSAYCGWVHFHESGDGMQCAKPVGDAPLQLKAFGENSDNIDRDDFDFLVEVEKKIELVELQPGQAIVFDDTMVHLSGWGQRFRVLVFG